MFQAQRSDTTSAGAVRPRKGKLNATEARRADTDLEESIRSAVSCVGLSGLLRCHFLSPGPHGPGRGYVGPIGPERHDAELLMYQSDFT